MKLIVGNTKTRAVAGGSDNLLDIDVMAELKDYLKVRPKGYQHSPLYRKRQWDGWRRFITGKGEFATGFLPMVAVFLKDLGVSIEIEDERENLIKIIPEYDHYVGNINGEDWFGRDYQNNMVKKIDNYIQVGDQLLYFPRGIFDCATNAGKNSMSALIMKNVPKDAKIIFTVSSTVIYKQAVEFFTDVLDGERLGQVSSGKYEPSRVTVCMVKTLLNRAKESVNVRKWLNEVQVLIVDESDEAGAKDYSKVLSYIGAGMRIFVSGTPLDAGAVNSMVAVGLSGKVLGKVTNKQLIDMEVSQKPTINILLNETPNKPFMSYSTEMDEYIFNSLNRVKLIAGVVNKHSDKQILITFQNIEHGYFMFEHLKQLCHSDIGIVHGTHKDFSCNRDFTIEQFAKNKISVLLASMILKRGANIPNINVLVMAQAGKSKTTVKQVTGRGLRHDGVNDEVVVYDFYDEGKFVSEHSRKRIKVYKDEEFEVVYTFEQKRGKPVK